MAQYIVDRGGVTWSGSALNASPTEFSLQINGDEKDTTPLSGSTVSHRSKMVGLNDWTASVTAFTSTPTMGSTGLITATGFPVAYARSWSMAIACEPAEATHFSSPTYRSYIPGLLSASGSFDCDLDSATGLSAPGTTASATFRLSDQATDHTIAATIYQLAIQSTQRIGDKATATVGYTTSGNITLAGSGGFTAILGSGTLAVPTAASLVLTSTTGRTYTGSAFWTGVTITCPVDDLISIAYQFRGSGTLTIA